MTAIELEQLLAAKPAFIDVRAPVEFKQGAAPGATNLPILTDAERHQVGITYKTAGAAKALNQGKTLVSGSIKRSRVDAWFDFAREHHNVWLYCWRGGQRSEIAQDWLKERGLTVARVPGGFKAIRRCCLRVLERAPQQTSWQILGGRTGSGKTQVIRQRAESHADSIDLEGLANHRGSAFGSRPGGQPTPVDFENRLAVAFLGLSAPLMLIEDESRTIGRLALPEAWFGHMQRAPVLILEATLAERVANIVREYVREPLACGGSADELLEHYLGAVDRIRRRLGGLRHREVSDALVHGFANDAHEAWIERLLSWYYDPMYDYQLAAKQDRVSIRGDATTLHEYLDEQAG